MIVIEFFVDRIWEIVDWVGMVLGLLFGFLFGWL
jgi:hypothetical protein